MDYLLVVYTGQGGTHHIRGLCASSSEARIAALLSYQIEHFIFTLLYLHEGAAKRPSCVPRTDSPQSA